MHRRRRRRIGLNGMAQITPATRHMRALGVQRLKWAFDRIQEFAYLLAFANWRPRCPSRELSCITKRPHGVTLHQTRVDYLVTAATLQAVLAARVHGCAGVQHRCALQLQDRGDAHVLEGELDLRCGERTVRGGPGTCVFVPPGAAHAFGNSGSSPGRMLLITAPPGHEKYFDELRDLVAKGGKPDPEALANLRAKYDTVQLATLTTG